MSTTAALTVSPRRGIRWCKSPGLVALLLLLAVGCSTHKIPSRSPGQAGAGLVERQILVTLAQQASAPSRAAGSTSGHYVRPSAYAISQRTRRSVRRLASQYDLRELDGWPIRALGVHCAVFEVPGSRSVDELIELLKQDRRVESVQRMNLFKIQADEPDDPYVEMQHGLHAMQVRDVHRWSGGKGVVVAVVDTGIDHRHPDLTDRVVMARDFVDEGNRTGEVAERHGTAVAGIIASSSNGLGTIGVAPEAHVIGLRACWEGVGSLGVCSSFTLAKALDFVVEVRPDIVNLSLSGPRDPLLERLTRTALDQGIAVVSAHCRGAKENMFPGSVPGVLIVENASEVSVKDPSLLRAPGQGILTTVPGEGFDFVSGSSFAAAHVSGVIALLLERAPDLDVDQLHTVLQGSSRPGPNPDHGSELMVNACAALTRIVPGTDCERPSHPSQHRTSTP